MQKDTQCLKQVEIINMHRPTGKKNLRPVLWTGDGCYLFLYALLRQEITINSRALKGNDTLMVGDNKKYIQWQQHTRNIMVQECLLSPYCAAFLRERERDVQ